MYYLDELPIFTPDVVGLDIETTGLDPFNDKILLVGLSDGYNTWIIKDGFDRLKSLLEDPKCLKVIHNAVFDLSFLCTAFKCDPANIWDTLIIEKTLNCGKTMDHKLDDVAARRLGVMMDKAVRETFINHQGEFTDEQLTYLENDVKYLVPIYQKQKSDTDAMGMAQVVSLENHVLLPVLDMVLTGVGFDLVLWESIQTEIKNTVNALYADMLKCLGYDFEIKVPRKKKGIEYLVSIHAEEINFSSPSQLLEVLGTIGINLSTTAHDALEKVIDQHPFVPLLLEYKKWSKMSTWDWTEYINPATGRMHPDWKQAGPETGRFACGNPNLQQVPRPTKGFPNMRLLFTGLPEHVLITADYSQQEPRILAGVSEDDGLLKAAQETDIYSAAGRDVYQREITKKDPERQLIKIGLLATFYGAREKGLAPKMGATVEVTKEFQSKVTTAYPKAAEWGNNQVKQVRQCGYSRTKIGRRRYFPEIQSVGSRDLWKYENVCRNNPIQGTGADATKLALWKIYKAIKDNKYDAHIIMTIHDEIVVSSNPNCADDVFKIVVESMENAASAVCPGVKFIAEGKISNVWEH